MQISIVTTILTYIPVCWLSSIKCIHTKP